MLLTQFAALPVFQTLSLNPLCNLGFFFFACLPTQSTTGPPLTEQSAGLFGHRKKQAAVSNKTPVLVQSEHTRATIHNDRGKVFCVGLFTNHCFVSRTTQVTNTRGKEFRVLECSVYMIQRIPVACVVEYFGHKFK